MCFIPEISRNFNRLARDAIKNRLPHGEADFGFN